MRVELGIADPPGGIAGPTVLTIPDLAGPSEDPDHTLAPGADVRDLALHLASNPGAVTRLPDQGLFVHVVQIVNAQGVKPSWAHVEDPADPASAAELERLLQGFYEIAGRPADFEDTHHTPNGPPGTGAPVEEVQP